jgi:phage terminase large subunit GpA-like protein
MPVKYLFADEISNWPADVDGEGDPLVLALERTNTFGRKRKVLLTSTPGLRGTCRIEREYLKTDQRRYHVACPHCGTLQVLRWDNFVIPQDDNGKYQPNQAHMKCTEDACRGEIHEKHKTDLLRGGVWIATAPQNAEATVAGYHISALYSPSGWKSWAKVAKQWLEAQGNKLLLKAFYNNVLAETYEEAGEKVDHTGLMARAEDYGTAVLPAGALLVTNGADVQPDRIELETVAWGLGEESWSIDYKVFMGDPDGPLVWQQLDAYLHTEFEHPAGVRLRAARTFIDTAGANTKAVYAYVEGRAHMGVFGIKGRGGDGVPAVGAPTRSNMAKIPLVPLGTFTLKDAVYGALTVQLPEYYVPGMSVPGYCHFPTRYGESFYKGLTAEEVRTKPNQKGFPVREWFKVYERNEPLDCRVYSTAAMLSLQPNFEHLHNAINGAAFSDQGVRQVRGQLETA